MGLDWVVVDKVVDGRTVTPEETLQVRPISRDDADIMAELRRLFDKYPDWVKELLRPPIPTPIPPSPSILARIGRLLGRKQPPPPPPPDEPAVQQP